MSGPAQFEARLGDGAIGYEPDSHGPPGGHWSWPLTTTIRSSASVGGRVHHLNSVVVTPTTTLFNVKCLHERCHDKVLARIGNGIVTVETIAVLGWVAGGTERSFPRAEYTTTVQTPVDGEPISVNSSV